MDMSEPFPGVLMESDVEVADELGRGSFGVVKQGILNGDHPFAVKVCYLPLLSCIHMCSCVIGACLRYSIGVHVLCRTAARQPRVVSRL